MKPSEIFLLMLSAAGGKISSKTLVQKRAYFLNLLLGLGLSYRPHYYGPYSPDLDVSIGQCKALGLVEQKTLGFGVNKGTGFEVRRFDFILTPDGSAVVEDLNKRKPEECRKVFECLERLSRAGDDDYVSLSVAAKTVHILGESKKPLSPEGIAAEAKKFGWDISQESIDKAASFLSGLGLVEEDGG